MSSMPDPKLTFEKQRHVQQHEQARARLDFSRKKRYACVRESNDLDHQHSLASDLANSSQDDHEQATDDTTYFKGAANLLGSS